MGIILAILKHSERNATDKEFIKCIETVGEIREAKILYVNT